MVSKFGALVILTLCFLVGQSGQEECMPPPVDELALYDYHMLAWWSPDEPCNITEFDVYIFHPDQPAEYTFTVTDRSTDVSFLEVCEEWVFVVVPISGPYVGPESRLVEKLPVDAESNLTIGYINVDHNVETGRTHLYWDLAHPEVGNCSLQYRVTIEEEGSPVVDDFYVRNTSLDLSVLSFCTTYQFSIRAINTAPPTKEGPISTETHLLPGRRQHPPVLLGTESTRFTITMTFNLESKVRNPCDLRELYIDGGSAISQSIYLSNVNRQNPLNVTLLNLTPNTKYDLKVYVSNTAGWSNATEVSASTLE